MQAAIEGLGIMLQKSTAPPPMAMPMDMPTVDAEAPATAETTLVGAGLPPTELESGMLDSAPDKAVPKKGGLFGMFASG